MADFLVVYVAEAHATGNDNNISIIYIYNVVLPSKLKQVDLKLRF